MNNEQFRKLLLANAANKNGADSGSPKSGANRPGEALGTRQRSSIPMTPRGAQIDFARQLAERNQSGPTKKKFKASAPRGIRLAEGYVDRATERNDNANDDREERLKALEELLKKGDIDQETYDNQRTEIAGGDLESTHLVKGLDFKLLERIRRGEVLQNSAEDAAWSEAADGDDVDVDDEFDQLEDQEITARKEEVVEKKKGQLSTVASVAGKKRTRNQILADFKAARMAAAAQSESALGGRFQKIGAKKMPGSHIERDNKGREVLIIIDEDGHEKRKVRKGPPDSDPMAADRGLLMPDKNATPLGMEVPEQYRQQAPVDEVEEDVDIFDDVGDDYDPLAGMADSDSDSDSVNMSKVGEKGRTKSPGEEDSAGAATTVQGSAATGSRNYFQGSKSGLLSTEAGKAPNMSDPAIMAAIKKAATLNPGLLQNDEDDDDVDRNKAKELEQRRQRLLQSASRDDDDMDLGFGTSRFEDEEDFDESKVKLSAWGDDRNGEHSAKGSGPSKRKRGPKKRKGDANNADDVLRVMEERKK